MITFIMQLQYYLLYTSYMQLELCSLQVQCSHRLPHDVAGICLVVFGVEEGPPKTPKGAHLQKDTITVVEMFSSLGVRVEPCCILEQLLTHACAADVMKLDIKYVQIYCC